MDDFTRAYLECALWSSTDESDEYGGEPLDKNYGVEDFAPESLQSAIEDCRDFQESFGDLVALGYGGRGGDGEEFSAEARAGHDFWLTRNHHGAGFWDGDWNISMPPDHEGARRCRTVGDYLTEMSHPYGSVDLYVGGDGLIHGD